MITAASEAADAVGALSAGCIAWVRLAGDPVVQRILLIDAPAALGWARWRELEERHALGLIRAAMQGARDEGLVRPDLVDSFAHMLLAAISEMALLVARADAQAMQSSTVAVGELVRRLSTGRRPSVPPFRRPGQRACASRPAGSSAGKSPRSGLRMTNWSSGA